MSTSRKTYNTFSPCQETAKPKQQPSRSLKMASKISLQPEPPKAAIPRRRSRAKSIENDVQRLAEMGYTQELSRGFSVLSILGTAFSLTNSWFGLSAAMATGINSGGPVLLVYGVIIVAVASVAVGISLSELASAIPNAGGQYFWASVLAPPKYARMASYLTGWFAYAGAVFTSASVSLSMASAIVGMYQLSHPDFVIEAWHVVVTYEIFNVVAFLFNVYGKILPKITTSTLYISIASFTTIIIAVPTSAPTRNTARYVFTTFINNTGWKENGMAFILGLVNTNWPFSCLDCATHLAEEVGSPERAIPIAIMGTIAMGFCTAWPFAIVMMISIQDTTGVTTTPTGVPILEIFNQALDKAGALGLESLIVLTGTGCQIACHTWQARLCWSFARDKGLPGSNVLSKINYKLDTPLAAHTISCIIDGLVGLLYLGSSAAFNSMVTATITLLYLSYSVPVMCLLIKGRSNIVHGPFWLGKVGLAANVVLLAWTLFTFVMYSFPTTRPVNAGNMNYISAVYGVLGVIIATDWFVRGRKQYQIQSVERRDSITGADRGNVTGAGVQDKSSYLE